MAQVYPIKKGSQELWIKNKKREVFSRTKQALLPPTPAKLVGYLSIRGWVYRVPKDSGLRAAFFVSRVKDWNSWMENLPQYNIQPSSQAKKNKQLAVSGMVSTYKERDLDLEIFSSHNSLKDTPDPDMEIVVAHTVEFSFPFDGNGFILRGDEQKRFSVETKFFISGPPLAVNQGSIQDRAAFSSKNTSAALS
ncbi:hypothetical protein ZEAMMB73_Zm00001d035825 [Zea mays]|uniref:Uncharacterized protein n=1 Tax=Zea mays TaxID=4577 RepID=A0A1D6LIY1_MAIZE|nr:hypothetical protein ZEAMMB73_Zm00001d035825 [Zea mays]